ncbi:MAG: hypothetical protein ABF335_00155 [Alphaproteobacteria bacterium]
MFRDSLANSSISLANKAKSVGLFVIAITFAACALTPKGAPPPPCSLDHCNTDPGPDEILTGPDLTRGWTFGRREDGALLIGKWQDKPSGYAIVKFNSAQTTVKDLSIALDGVPSRVPSDVLECISGTTPDKIAWIFHKTDDPKWGGTFRRILIGFTETRAKLKSNQSIKLDHQSHINVDFNGDQIMRIDYNIANGSFISESGDKGCAQDLIPVKY